MISIVAFVINIGLFVKAKINLQNATDSAAFAGAAVQARQLSKIAYLNWEMRNIYKEWMYKYYVIGNLNIADVENGSGTGVMHFNLQPDVNVLKANQEARDPFNIPAVCIHIAGSQTNICKRYSIPGLPEFGSSNLVGAEEASRAFMDALIATKVNDCIDRTRLNMLVANTWTYNVLANNMDQTLAGKGPAILADRQGAWPKAVELGIRIRNLEYVMNRPAEEAKVCNNGSTSLTGCSKGINDIIAEGKLGNERLVKAFYSGYRNLGNDIDNEMKNSFTLTELAPTTVPYTKKEDASYLLTRSGLNQGKQYVDLKLMMVNYAIFYAAMIPRAETDTSGACDVSKVAIPVPGYPLGFYKNPDVMTYYAVKGEAEFIGMFNPFQSGGVKLTAYSAAKPFGGRIGPMLFTQKQNEDYIIGRTDKQKLRSVPYLTSPKFSGVTVRGTVLTKTNFVPGAPIPPDSNQPFWLSNPGNPLGGLVADSNGVQFGIPNMPYDYEAPFTSQGYSNAATEIHTIQASNDSLASADEPIGLYSKSQFYKFRGNNLSNSIPVDVLDKEIGRVKAPTLYEAANYLIPTPHDFNIKNNLDSFGFVNGNPQDLGNGVIRYPSKVYAPLYKNNDQTDLMFNNPNEVLTAIYDFMRAQESGIDKYKRSLNQAAKAVYDMKDKASGKGQEGSAPGYVKAATGISNISFAPFDADENPDNCNSVAGQFLHFYYGPPGGDLPSKVKDNTGCTKDLGSLLREYFSESVANSNYDPNFYNFDFHWPTAFEGAEGMKMMTAYAPGPFTGIGQDGTFTNPIPGSDITERMRRNFYSTKFISLDSMRAGGGYSQTTNNFAIHSEGDTSTKMENAYQKEFKNPLKDSDSASIKY